MKTYRLSPRDERQLWRAMRQRGTNLVHLECGTVVHVTTNHRPRDSEISVAVVRDGQPTEVFKTTTAALTMACTKAAAAIEAHLSRGRAA